MWQAWLGGQLLAVLSNSKEQENATISEIGDELEELEMEPKQESFWWTSTCGEEEAGMITSGWDGKE